MLRDPCWIGRLRESCEGPHPGLPPNQSTDLGEGENRVWMKREMRNSVSVQVQRRIVGYLDGLSERINELRRLQSESQVELDALLPSVLDRAFKGEL